MRDIKPKESKFLSQYLTNKYIRYGSASALTIALYLFSNNGAAYAGENQTPQAQGVEATTSQTTPENMTNNNVNNKATTTNTENNEEEDYDSSYGLPILYVTVWMDNQGNILKDAVEDAKTPKSERQPIKIPGYRHYKTSMSDGITKFLYKRVGTSTNSTNNANATNVTESKPIVDTQSNKQPNNDKDQQNVQSSIVKKTEQPEAKQNTTKEEPSKQPEVNKGEAKQDTTKEELLKQPEVKKEEVEQDTTKKEPSKQPEVNKDKPDTDKNVNQGTTLKMPILKITIWVDEKGNIIKDEVEDSKTSESERQPIQIKGYQFIKTVTENGITKHIYKKVNLPCQSCEPNKNCKITGKEKTRNENIKDCAQSEYKDENKKGEKKTKSERQLPETGTSQNNQNPALMMLLTGLGILGLYRKKVKD